MTDLYLFYFIDLFYFIFFKGIYETRLEEYHEEMAEMSRSLKANVKELGRKMINLIIESGESFPKMYNYVCFS